MKNLFLSSICLFLALTCQARTFTVQADGLGDYPTIQAAIDGSNSLKILI